MADTHDNLIPINDNNYIVKNEIKKEGKDGKIDIENIEYEKLKLGDNLIAVDTVLSLYPNKIDNERTEYIKKLKLETNFYNVFRNTIRILINNYKNLDNREKIEKELDLPTILYNTKLKTIEEELKHLAKDAIRFIENRHFDHNTINEVYTCIINNIGKDNDNVQKKNHYVKLLDLFAKCYYQSIIY